MEEANYNPEHHSRKHKKLNVWMVATVVFAALLIIVLFTGFSFTGQVTKNSVSDGLVSLLESQGYSGFSVKDTSVVEGMYLIVLSYQGEDVPFYVTKTGYIIGNSLVSIVSKEPVASQPESPVNTEVVKSDKPVAELFIWSYCPYGVNAQKPFAEVALLLKDYATFDASLYYAGHGEYELEQNKIQACIQKNYPDKYWNYATKFVDQIYPNCGASRNLSCDKSESVKLMKSLGIDSTKILSCVEKEGQALVDQDASRASSLGVKGSPTIVINGAEVSVSKDASSILDAVCSAFTNAPELCGTTLSSTSATTSAQC